MPKKTLSFEDYILIATERMRGQSQEKIAKMFNVSVSLISKLEKHNTQYRQVQKDLQNSIIRETGRLKAFTHVATEAQKPVEAVTKAIAQIQSEVQQPAVDVKKILDAQVRAIASMKTEVQKPVEAVTKAIVQIQSEVQQPAVDVKKILDAQVRAIASMKTEVQKPVEAVTKAIAQIESLNTKVQKPVEAVTRAITQIESLATKVQKAPKTNERTDTMKAPPVPNLMDPMNLQNIPFQGYRIQGIDSHNLPLDTENRGDYRILLKPIAGLGYAEEQEIWENCFNNNETVVNWTSYGHSLPRLRYIPTAPELVLSGKCGYIQAGNTNPELLKEYASRMAKIIGQVNEATLQLIQERNSIREDIDAINSTHFGN